MRSLRPFLWLLLAVISFAASSAHAELPPRPTGPIADLAAIIPDGEEAALDRKLRDYNKTTGQAIIVATVPSLDGQVIERYAQDLARSWDIGGKESQEGVLVLVAPNERKMRIHPAVGAQGRLTDGLASRIIRETMAPKFKEGNFGGGIDAGVDQVIAQMNRDEVDAVAVAEAAEAAKHAGRSSGGIGIGSVIFWGVLVLSLLLLFMRGARRRAQRRRGYGHGIDLWDIGEVAVNVAANVAINSVFDGDGGGGGDSDGGFGGFGGGGGGFDGGGASGDW